MNKLLTALFGAVFLLATFFGGSRTADLQAEIVALREAVERPEVVKEEVIVEIEKPTVDSVNVSSLTGSYYLRIHAAIAWNDSTSLIRVYKIWGQ